MSTPTSIPPQHQSRQPGLEAAMRPQPDSGAEDYVGSGRLRGRVALITGGDSGIGRAIAVAFAREGADVAIAYLDEHADARETVELVEGASRKCLAIAGDLADHAHAEAVARQALQQYGKLDILVRDNRSRWRRALCSWRLTRPAISPGRSCTSTAARSSTAEAPGQGM
ncbi:SDR family NAD(P)-dependent oxidoreductase [Cupriavidus sp. CP313]